MYNTNLNLKKKANRLMSLDYLKAFAISLVIINHTLTDSQLLKVDGPFWINMAVPIFIIISGFTHSMSARKKNITTFKEYFNIRLMSNKVSRLLIPYLIIFIIELLIEPESHRPLLLSFITGGIGPGSYYFPILIQLLFLFPFMYFAYKKSPSGSIIFFFIAHYYFNVMTIALPIPDDLYRLLIFRYLVFIIMGIALYNNGKGMSERLRNIFICLSVVSLGFIYLVNYTHYTPVVFKLWKKTSLPTVFLALVIVILGMRYLEIKNTNIVTNTISKIGQSSYHIFLTQKLVFGFGIHRYLQGIGLNVFLRGISLIFLCFLIGYIFYLLECKIRRLVF